MPASSHSSVPSSEYERIFFVPFVMISVRCAFSQTNGDAQLLASSRLMRQSSLPFAVLYAAMNDSSSLSLTMTMRSLASTGEAELPQPVRVLRGVIGFDHTGLPVMSNANRPAYEKYA